MLVLLKDLELKMWAKTEMPEAKRDADNKIVKVDGKIQNTGRLIEYTTYTLRDLKGEVLEIMSAKNNFREHEGKVVNVVLNLTKKSFQGKSETKISLDTIEPVIKI